MSRTGIVKLYFAVNILRTKSKMRIYVDKYSESSCILDLHFMRGTNRKIPTWGGVIEFLGIQFRNGAETALKWCNFKNLYFYTPKHRTAQLPCLVHLCF